MENNELVLCSWCHCSIMDEPLYIKGYPNDPLCSEECIEAVLDNVIRARRAFVAENEEVDDENLQF